VTPAIGAKRTDEDRVRDPIFTKDAIQGFALPSLAKLGERGNVLEEIVPVKSFFLILFPLF
jgi:hypothetical protein